MKRRITTGVIALVALSVLAAGCDSAANDNRTVNANAPMSSPTPVVANTNANTDTRRAPTREEYERDRERYSREARESGRTIGTGLNDGWLWVKTRFDLAAAEDLRDSTIDVDVDNGVVTLTGTVATAAQKARAEAVAKAVEDVTSVRNNLRVAADNANTRGTNDNR